LLVPLLIATLVFAVHIDGRPAISLYERGRPVFSRQPFLCLPTRPNHREPNFIPVPLVEGSSSSLCVRAFPPSCDPPMSPPPTYRRGAPLSLFPSMTPVVFSSCFPIPPRPPLLPTAAESSFGEPAFFPLCVRSQPSLAGFFLSSLVHPHHARLALLFLETDRVLSSWESFLTPVVPDRVGSLLPLSRKTRISKK